MTERRPWEIELATLEKVQVYWPHIASMMERMPNTLANHTPQSLFELCMEGGVQLWLVGREKHELAMLSSISNYPNARVLEIFWGAGTGALKSGPIVDATIEQFAKKTGCDRIDVHGRPGWEKIMEPYGFKKLSIIMSKPVYASGRH